ncbi:hypothetical protein [Nocardia abscessus]|uniref:hypothetical protein n=1 Tax=Nocardia abscessus TaxID=120957 RepID=UPI002456BFD6|nr:hypothetical protein [Nocardia abscessus]
MSDELLNLLRSLPWASVAQQEPKQIERAPRELWRVWDREWRQVGEWTERPPASAFIDGGGVTVDFQNGLRQSWRVVGSELWDEVDLLRNIQCPPNPWLEGGSNP